MSERYIVDLPISPVSADVAGAPASMIEHYVRCVGRPESSNLTSFAVSPLSDGDGWQLVPVEPTPSIINAMGREVYGPDWSNGDVFDTPVFAAAWRAGVQAAFPAPPRDELAHD